MTRTLSVLLSALLLVTGYQVVTSQQDGRGPSATDYIRARGFLCEPYVIQTSGYPLTLYRIINPLANPDTLNRYPVLYGHGLWFDALSMISSADNSRPRIPVLGRPTVMHAGTSLDGSDDYSLPFMLSNNNFDVWLFDARGTNDKNRDFVATMSLTNEFWNYSLDDQLLRDIPLMIDFVLTRTASSQLVYVGFSESTTFLFALLSKVPEFADKIVAALQLAPVAYVHHVRGATIPALAPLVLVSDSINRVAAPTALIDLTDSLLKTMCFQRTMSHLICGQLMQLLGGIGNSQNRPSFYEQFLKSTSLKTMKHFAQLFLGSRFGMYDYGPAENLRRYGQVAPPRYDLSQIRSDRIILARGLADFVANPDDVSLLLKEMGVKPYKDIVVPSYGHFDFIDGRDLIRLVNQPAVEAIYELMYKNGPEILKSPEQVMATPGGKTNTVEFVPSEATLKAMSYLEPHRPQSNTNSINQILNPFSLLTGTITNIMNLG